MVVVEGTRRRGRRRCLDIIIGTMERDKICLEDGVWKMGKEREGRRRVVGSCWHMDGSFEMWR